MRKKIILRIVCVFAFGAAIFGYLMVTDKIFTQAAGEPTLKFVSPLVKVFKNKPVSGAASVSIKAAKNEYESFQAVLTAGGSAVSITNASMGDLTGPGGTMISGENIELFNIEYAPNISQVSGASGNQWKCYEAGWLGPDRRMSADGQTQLFDYSYWTTGEYPDPLVPFVDPVSKASVTQSWSQSRGGSKWALPISVPANQNRGIWVDVFVPKSAPAGNYSGVFTINYSDGTAKTITMPVNLQVWNFTLPDQPSLKQFWAMTLYYIQNFYNAPLSSSEYDRIEERHADLLKKHRMTVPMPHKLTPQSNSQGGLIFEDNDSGDDYKNTEPALMKAWLDKYKPTTIFAWRYAYPPSESVLTAYLSNLINWYRENGMSEYLDKLYYYLYDEPGTAEAYSYIARYGDNIPSSIKALVTEPIYPQDKSWAPIDSSVDTWVPLWTQIDPESVASALQRGKEVWSYICCNQNVPSYHPDYATLYRDFRSPWWHIDRPTNHYRFPAWITYRYNMSGFLYWHIMRNDLANVINPWDNPYDSLNNANGEGVMVYPGSRAGFNAPIASLRMKAFRDSAEDYEYMKLLEAKSGRNAVLAYTNQIVPEWWEFEPSYQTMESMRDAMGEAINGGPISTPTATPTPYPTPALTPTPTPQTDPVAWLKFDDSLSDGVASDHSAFANAGTCSSINCPSQAIGKDGVDGTAYLFDGTNDYLNLGSKSSLELTGNFTISLWFNAQSWPSSNWPAFVSKRDSFAGMDWELYYDNAAKEIRFVYGNYAGNVLFAGSKIDPSLGSWHLLNITRNGNAFTLYLDGQAKAAANSSATMPTGDSIRIGALGNDELANIFKGRMDDFRLYNRALSAAEIQNLHVSDFESADFNSDTRVNSVDFGILMSWWGSNARPKSDINQDSYVNSVDFGIMLSQWTG